MDVDKSVACEMCFSAMRSRLWFMLCVRRTCSGCEACLRWRRRQRKNIKKAAISKRMKPPTAIPAMAPVGSLEDDLDLEAVSAVTLFVASGCTVVVTLFGPDTVNPNEVEGFGDSVGPDVIEGLETAEVGEEDDICDGVGIATVDPEGAMNIFIFEIGRTEVGGVKAF